MDDPEDKDADIFLEKYGELIDELIGGDVSTEETFRFSEAADDGEMFSAMDIERIVGDLFSIRIRYALALIALGAIQTLTKPREKWRKSMRDVKNAEIKLKVMFQLMESLNERKEDDEEGKSENS
jgi:hypothetical protein